MTDTLRRVWATSVFHGKPCDTAMPVYKAEDVERVVADNAALLELLTGWVNWEGSMTGGLTEQQRLASASRKALSGFHAGVALQAALAAKDDGYTGERTTWTLVPKQGEPISLNLPAPLMQYILELDQQLAAQSASLAQVQARVKELEGER